MRAIVSVSDKRGLLEFARGLRDLGVALYSTGGTKQALANDGVAVQSISDLTGFPEILDGRVKTLHPAVHGGLLARRDRPDDLAAIAQLGITPIDLVCVNLYPFVEAVAKPDATLTDALENIDIGGPTMLRASAKNFPSVLVVCDPDDYPWVLEALRQGGVSLDQRRALATKAFQHTAAYDTAIAQYLRADTDPFPKTLTFALSKAQDLRYGENPHQRAAFYREIRPGARGLRIANAKQLHGAELSFNNILDAEGALAAAADFAPPTVAIIKHTNPCGLACRPSLADAYRAAFAGDPVSAYGGIVALNRPVDLATARGISETFYEIVIAPRFDDDALALLKKKRNLRLLEMGDFMPPHTPAPVAWDATTLEEQWASAYRQIVPGNGHLSDDYDVRRVSGGLLVQTRDVGPEQPFPVKLLSQRAPTMAEVRDLLFAWRAVKHVKSNAITIAKDLALLGMGAGQPNRVTSVSIALERAGEAARGAVLASDAFFPFPDGVEAAARGGVSAVIQPGGSIRDAEVIAAADAHGMAMIATGMRHFKH